MNEKLQHAAKQAGIYLSRRGLRLATAESCTGGLITYMLCATEDTTAFYSSGFITYTNEAKQRMLGVSAETLRLYTAVSEQTVHEMAAGARERSGEDVSLSVSGYAGPDGGEDGTPPGTVWFGWACRVMKPSRKNTTSTAIRKPWLSRPPFSRWSAWSSC